MPSGAVCAGSNPAGGTLYEVPKDPVTSGNAEAGVFVFVQPSAARSGRMSGSVDELWTGSWSIAAGHLAPRDRAELFFIFPVLDHTARVESMTIA
jgi:hypothetical protein